MVAASTTPTSAPSTDPPQTDFSRRLPMGFQQGLSGLSTASKNLEVIGNNVANSNTYGEKTSRAEFSDMYAAAMTGLAGNNIEAGIGVQVATVSQQFTQGNITPTGNPLDLAINGNGFFQTKDSSN